MAPFDFAQGRLFGRAVLRVRNYGYGAAIREDEPIIIAPVGARVETHGKAAGLEATSLTRTFSSTRHLH